jgi:membrane protein implicated in regulation of membrane protease activity
MKKYIEKYKVASNVDALIGCPAVVVEEIKPNKKGKVKIASEVWLAVSQEEFKVNDVATVVSVDGTKLVVKKNIN